MRTSIAAKRDITRTVYHANMCAYENSGIRNRWLYLTLEQISLIVRYSLNRDNTAWIMCTSAFTTTFCGSECLDLFLV